MLTGKAPAPRVRSNGGSVTGAPRRMLVAMARAHPRKLTRSQIGLLLGVKSSTGSFGANLSLLKTARYIEVDSRGYHRVTTRGFQVGLGSEQPPPPQSTDEVVQMWRSVLAPAVVRVFDVLRSAYPVPLYREQIASHLRLKPNTGSFGSYLTVLRENGLIVAGDRGFTLSPDLVEVSK